jgi:NADH:ubiquinone oxidoreductase subunit 5 (subunit L)/multisubunit Na+/H+ antiporter MnhA subunit
MKQSKKILKNEEPKHSKKIKKEKAEESSEAVKLIKIILIVVAIFFAMYGLTYLIKGKSSSTSSEFKFSNEIIVGQMWSHSTNTTAIILLDYSTDSDVSTYQTDIQNFVKANTSYTYYSVDLGSVFNKNSIAETSNLKATNGDFKVSGVTILVMKDGVVSETYEGKDAVASYAASLESQVQSTSTASESTLISTESTSE